MIQNDANKNRIVVKSVISNCNWNSKRLGSKGPNRKIEDV